MPKPKGMGLKLGEMLVSRGLITRGQLSDALLAQRQFGGKLGTNLVEMGVLSDDQLATCLSEQLGLPWVRPQALGSIPNDVIARFPRKLAEGYRVVPLKHDRAWHVCMADPQNFERLDELRFALGTQVKPYVVTEVSLNYALERYYGIQREARFHRAAKALLDGDDSVPHDVSAPMLSDPFGGALAEPFAAPKAAPSTSVIDDLANAMTDDDVFRALLRYFVDQFDHAVILNVAEGYAVPTLMSDRLARRPGPMSGALMVSSGTLLHAVIARPQVVWKERLDDATLAGLCQSVSMPPSKITLAPVLDGPRVRVLVLAQGLDEGTLTQLSIGMRKFLGKVSQALRIVALRASIRDV